MPKRNTPAFLQTREKALHAGKMSKLLLCTPANFAWVCDRLDISRQNHAHVLVVVIRIVLRTGGVLSPNLYVDVPAGPRKSDFLYTHFLPNFPPISIPFSKEKHPILTKLDAFYNNLPKIHPIYVIWAPLSLMKPPNRYTKFHEKSHKRQAHIRILCQCENPPRLRTCFKIKIFTCDSALL